MDDGTAMGLALLNGISKLVWFLSGIGWVILALYKWLGRAAYSWKYVWILLGITVVSTVVIGASKEAIRYQERKKPRRIKRGERPIS